MDIPLGYLHIKESATKGIDIFVDEIEKLLK